MKINSFKNQNYTIYKEPDDTGRDIGYSHYFDCTLHGRNTHYPNILIHSNQIANIYLCPYDEKIMSFNKDSFYENNEFEALDMCSVYEITIETPVFFFIYNFDNYYHFIYDTLPYLYMYLELKKNVPNLKLLVNYPNAYKRDFYKFNTEFLEKMIDINDIIIHNNLNTYTQIYVSSSLTHGGYSNNPPRHEIHHIYNLITEKNVSGLVSQHVHFEMQMDNMQSFPRKIYISRRTWINKNTSNLGTDYTTRRKMMNEEALVHELNILGFTEIFTENLSVDEKIGLFANAEIVVGSIGGGMSNLLFSSPDTKSVVLVTPYFLDINYRFKYSMEHTKITYFDDIETYSENEIPLYCRIKTNAEGKIGEIIGYDKNKYIIQLSNNDVAGFNNALTYSKCILDKGEFELLDKGLSSPYRVNIQRLLSILKVWR